MMLALAFVPVGDVPAALELLYEEIPENMPVVSNFEELYINGKKFRGNRRNIPPRYPPKLWNCYDATLQNLHRTNNISEGWHTRFQTVVGKHHPSLYGCLTEFQKEQADCETMLDQLDLGQRVKAASKKKWLRTQQRIRNIVATYEEYATSNRQVDYLRNVGYNFVL